jgi:outer membrane receptor protein involved in Fe transport
MGSFEAAVRRAAFAVALACVAVQPALAQTPAPEAATTTTEVIVTGSRIKQPNLTSTSPIQVVGERDIQLSGTTDMISLLNTLPQQFMNNGTDFSGTSQVLAGAGGISTADLRGLGPQRTLVLIDGKRLGTGDANTANNNPAPDLNQIPVQLVQRVEVVTGGASAVYGSDAIAGVINFIMKRDFEGLMIDGQYGLDDHTNGNSYMQGLLSRGGFNEPPHHVNDGYNRSLAVMVGMNGADDKANATAYFTYLRQDPVSQGRRDYSACKLNVAADANNVINRAKCSGSSNSNLFEPQGGPNALNDFSVVGNQLLPYPQAGSVPPALFNSNPYQYLLHQDERYTGGLLSHYDFSDRVKVYADLNFMNDKTLVQIGPSGAFAGGNPFDPLGNGGWLVSCNNPLLSAQEQGVLCGPGVNTGSVDVLIGRRNIEGIGRTSYFEHMNYRGVFGVQGDIVPNTWSYDVYAQYYYTSLYFNQGNDLSNTNIGNALNVAPDGTCGPGCVPWNLWTQGGVNAKQLAYLLENSLSYGTVKQEIFSGSVAGDLSHYGVKLPAASDGLRVSIGAERRVETLGYQPDKTAGSGDLSGGAGAAPTINGGYSVNEVFAEARLPLAQGQLGIDDLVLETGYRYSRYSTAGDVSSFKLGLQYAPVQDVRVRAAFQRAIRAPNIIELFNPAVVTQTSIVGQDPCAGPNPATSLQQCEYTGVTPAQYGHIAQCPAGQCSALLGGNPNLRPETANTVSVGLTLTPAFLPGFTGSIDYYRIKISDEISALPINIDLALCLDANSAACALIQRGPNGQLFGQATGFFKNLNANIAEALVSGIDLQLDYGVPLPSGWGRLEATLNGSYLQKSELTPIRGFSYDCAGLYGVTCQTVNPKWRHNLRLSWQTPWKILLSAQWRFIGSVSLDTNDSQPSLQLINSTTNGGSYDAFDAKLGSRSYLDLAGYWEISRHFTLRAGVNNVLDRDPPLVNSFVSQTGSPNSFPTYDLLGRVVFVGARALF